MPPRHQTKTPIIQAGEKKPFAGRLFMNTAAESIQKMILAHFNGDEVEFRAAVEEYIADERRKNHHVLVREMEQTLSRSNGSTHRRPEVLSLLGIQNDSLPRDKERGVVLVEVKEAERRLDNLVLKPEIRATLDRVVLECKNRDLLGTHGIQPVRRILFCGPPGCGKTVAAEALAKAIYLPLTTARFDAVVSSYLGETAANLRKVFDFARSRPMALFFDEFDAIGKHRTADDEHGELKRVVNSFLQLLDAFRGEAITIAATNHQGLLDSALWRRFDEIIYFSPPDKREIVELLTRGFRQIGVAPSVSFDRVADALVGMSHADVERTINDAIKRSVITGGCKVECDVLEQCVEQQIKRLEITGWVDGLTGRLKQAKSNRRKRV